MDKQVMKESVQLRLGTNISLDNFLEVQEVLKQTMQTRQDPVALLLCLVWQRVPPQLIAIT
jgi:hypothetical protein